MGSRRIVRAAKVLPAASIAVLAFAGTASAAPSSSGASVCNEAENSARGGYTVSGDPVDPVPPAFLRGGAGHQMRLGNGHGTGLVGASLHSPALRTCTQGDGSGGDPTPT